MHKNYAHRHTLTEKKTCINGYILMTTRRSCTFFYMRVSGLNVKQLNAALPPLHKAIVFQPFKKVQQRRMITKVYSNIHVFFFVNGHLHAQVLCKNGLLLSAHRLLVFTFFCPRTRFLSINPFDLQLKINSERRFPSYFHYVVIYWFLLRWYAVCHINEWEWEHISRLSRWEGSIKDKNKR
jgi:hypothetical protein